MADLNQGQLHDRPEVRQLPIEVWRMIFMDLDKKTRLNCRLVCNEWSAMLGHDAAFKSDRTLYLTHGYLHEKHPAVIALSHSTLKFEKLSMAHVAVDPSSDLSQFWQRIGQSVKEITIEGRYRVFLVRVLAHFHNVEKLRVEYLLWELMDTELADIEALHCPSVRVLTVTSLIAHEYSQQISRFLDALPNLQEIHILRLIAWSPEVSEILMLHLSKIRTMGFSSITPPIPIPNNLHHILFVFKNEINPILQLQNNLQSFAVLNTSQLPNMRVELIDELEIFARGILEPTELESFVNFKNLKRLTLIVSRSGCFCSHNLVPEGANQLTELSIRKLVIRILTCKECLNALLAHFTHIKKFKLEISPNESFFIEPILAQHLHRFCELKLVLHDSYGRQEIKCDLLVLLGTNLTHLSVSLQTVEDFEAVTAALPYLTILRKLKLSFQFAFKENHLKSMNEVRNQLIMLESFSCVAQHTGLQDLFRLSKESPRQVKRIHVEWSRQLGEKISEDDILSNILDVYNRFPNLQCFELGTYKFSRAVMEGYNFIHSNDIGPSVHKWPLMDKIQSVVKS